MANKNTILTYSVAKRQLNALVRKYKQGTKTNLGFNLTISVDDYDIPNMINYTLIMKNHFEDAWEVRRISFMLRNDIQVAFTQKVTYMEDRLASAISARITNSI